jgi:V/A-type H+-transporting ATPase subunit A
MWALDSSLAHKRVFPAVDLEISYTLFVNEISLWMNEHAGDDWLTLRANVLDLLQRERELEDIAALIGKDALQDRERFVLEAAALFREVVLQQNAFHPVDATSSLPKTHALAALTYDWYAVGLEALAAGSAPEDLDLATVRAGLLRVRHAAGEDWRELASGVRADLEALSVPPTESGGASS